MHPLKKNLLFRKKMTKRNTLDLYEIYFIFFLWPVFSLFFAYKNHKYHHVLQNIITLYSGFIGLTFVVSSDSPDINRYRDAFLYYSTYNFTDFIQRFFSYITLNDTQTTDFFLDTVLFILSRITDNYLALFLTFGLIFGFFYSKTIVTLLHRAQYKIDYKRLMLITGIIFIINPAHGINQFRFYTASIVFVFGSLQYILSEKKCFLLIAASSILIHFGLLPCVIGLLMLSIVGWNYTLLIPLAIISITYSGFDLPLLSKYTSFFGGAFEYKFNSYALSSYSYQLIEKLQSRTWYAVYWQDIILYPLYILFFAYIIKTNILNDRTLKKYVPFVLSMIIVINFIGDLSMSFRYNNLLILIILICLFLFESIPVHHHHPKEGPRNRKTLKNRTYPQKSLANAVSGDTYMGHINQPPSIRFRIDIDTLYKVSFPAFALMYAIQARYMIGFVDIFILFKNPLTVLLMPADFSVAQFLGLE